MNFLQGSDVSMIPQLSLLCVSSPMWGTLQYNLNLNLACIGDNSEYPMVMHKYSSMLHKEGSNQDK